MDIDWQSIRTINGSQREGFEELVVQLARTESPASAKFDRVGSPDAGVECYCVLDGGCEWGWQAKYFTSALTPGQWGQLDDSVKTALDKRPELVRYFVCIPRNRSDPVSLVRNQPCNSGTSVFPSGKAGRKSAT